MGTALYLPELCKELFTVKKNRLVTVIARIWGLALLLSFYPRKFLLFHPYCRDAMLPGHSVSRRTYSVTVGHDWKRHLSYLEVCGM